MPTLHLTKASIEALQPPARGSAWYWDDKVPGFGLRVHASGRRAYVFRYALGRRSRQKRITIGLHDAPWTPAQARAKAESMLGAVADGRDPMSERHEGRRRLTVREWGARYLAEVADVHKNPRTAEGNRRCLELHVYPVLGGERLDLVTRARVAQLHRSMRETPTTANRVLALLSHMFNVARNWGLLPENHVNPARGVQRYEERPRERYLDNAELRRLSVALDALDALASREWEVRQHVARQEDGQSAGISQQALYAIRLCLLTGARAGEIAGLRWEHVDLEAGLALVPRPKEKRPKRLVLVPAAVELLEKIPRMGEWVFPGRSRGQMQSGSITHGWVRVREVAKLDGVRLHDLRHTFASVAIEAGLDLPQVGGLLGHASPVTTQRYAHLRDAARRAAATATAAAIQAAMAAEVKAEQEGQASA
jgi:integrase